MVALSFIQPVKSRRFQGEQRDIQKIRWAFTRGRCGRAVLRHCTRACPAKDHHRLVRQGLLQIRGRRALEAIKKFEAKTGIKVELSQYAIQDMIPKTVAALDSGTVPDVAYSDNYDVQAR